MNSCRAMAGGAVQYLLVAALPITLAAGAAGASAKSLLEIEKNHIDKIVRLTAREHSTILFEIGGYDEHAVGYVNDGHLGWIDSKPVSSQCEVEGDPGEISWSWDDTWIAFYERGISAVSVQDRVKRVLVPQTAFDGWSRMQWYPIQWLHNGKDLVLELSKEIPIGKTGTAFTDQSGLFVASAGHVHRITSGREPAVSPLLDRIANYASGLFVDGNGRVAAINADGADQAVLARASTRLAIFQHHFLGNIVWSPDGTRLFFGELASENLSDKLHLLGVKGRYQDFLSNTSITIRGWH